MFVDDKQIAWHIAAATIWKNRFGKIVLSNTLNSSTFSQPSHEREYYLERMEPIRKTEEDDIKYNERVSRWQQMNNESYNKAEIIIAKQRHGPIGSIKMHFDANLTKFSVADKFILPAYFSENFWTSTVLVRQFWCEINSEPGTGYPFGYPL